MAAYQRHYNGHRPHQARNQLPPGSREHPAAVQELDKRRMLRRRTLGGPNQRVSLCRLTSGDDFSSGAPNRSTCQRTSDTWKSVNETGSAEPSTSTDTLLDQAG
ncbi:hypothetical protein [Streptomyces sp. NPDC056242]|uniref:hypothetical protein n=1 Tax=Streptomyces sp. NPDC056242 TaxID=3345760 RepID=UPI0035E200C2